MSLNHNKKISLSVIILIIMILSSCSSNSSDSNKMSYKTSTDSTSIWEVSIKDMKVSPKLDTTTKVKQYDGSLMDVTYSNAPSDGNEYLLLEIEVHKIGTGNMAFEWNDVTIKDIKSDIEYKRVEDVFLTDHGYQRMSGTDLKIGDNDGWICFEIPEDSKTSDLEFLYIAGDEKIQISLDQ